MSFKIVFCFFMVALFCGCQSSDKELSPEKYTKWIFSKDHGLIKEKSVSNVKISVRFLPSQYLAYREYINTEKSKPFDSIWVAYKCGLTFQVTLEAEKNDARYGNLMYYNISSQPELTARTQYLSFKIQEFIFLSRDETTIEPVLSNFEGFDQLGNKLSFQVSFILPDYQCGQKNNNFKDFALVFDDPFLDLGTNQFAFDSRSILDIPKLVNP